MAFVANRIKLTGISGQTEDLFVDFIGTSLDLMPYDDWENDEIGTALIVNKDGNMFINNNTDIAKGLCIHHCTKKGEIHGAYSGIRLVDTNKYRCICLDRSLSGLVGMIKSPSKDPRTSVKDHPAGLNPFFLYKR